MLHRVVDCSRYTGLKIDWDAVRASGVEGCYVQANEGNYRINEFFERQVEGARAAGLLVGFYSLIYCLPDDGVHANRDPTGQLGICANVVGPHGPFDLVPMVDCEQPPPARWALDKVTSGFASGWIASFAAQLDQLTTRKSGIYTGFGFWPAMEGAGLLECFLARALWLGKYPGAVNTWPPDDVAFPKPPAPWFDAMLWQFGDKLLIGGVELDGSVCDDAGWNVLQA